MAPASRPRATMPSSSKATASKAWARRRAMSNWRIAGTVEVIDAGGQWVMPGLLDAHCHVSYRYPVSKGEGKGRGTTRPEFSTLKSARSVQKVLRSGVTGISVPGGTWFTDVGVRDAIKLGLMEGPRMYVAGRMIVTYGCIEDDEPSW